MAERGALDAAFAIGARLCRDALWDGSRCNWTADRLIRRDESWHTIHGPISADLYAGSAGVAVFLARLHEVQGEPLLRRVAEAALRQSLRATEVLQAAGRLGYFDGLAGLAHACLDCGEHWQSEAWYASGRGLLRRLASAGAAWTEADYLSGRAGGIAVLLRWRDVLPEGQAVQAAVALAEHGWPATWERGPAESVQETGAAHGWVGPAWVLAALAAATGEPRWSERSLQAWQAYRQRRAALATRDLPVRASRRSPLGALGWCHGAAGVGLAQLRCLQVREDPDLRATHDRLLGTALQALRALPEGPCDLSLCHGLGGVLEWLAAVRRQADGGQAAELDAALAGLVGRFLAVTETAADGPLPDGSERVGLMLGWSGIGASLLRLHQPALPSILMP